MRTRTLLSWPLMLALLAPAAVGCDGGDDDKDAGPPVSVMELPISLRNDGNPPGAAPLIEISKKELLVDGDKLYDLDDGRLPKELRDKTKLPKLVSKIGGKGAKVRMHVHAAYRTMALVAASAAEGGGKLAFEVRKGPTAETGWLVLDDYEAAPKQEWVEFDGPPEQRMWDDFVPHWEHAYETCQASDHVDCDFVKQRIAEGGKVQIQLFARDSALKLMFDRFGAPEPEEGEEGEEGEGEAEKKGGAGAGLLEGVRAPQGAEEEELPPPAEKAHFAWRHERATQKDSPISKAIRPVCGAKTCGVVVVSEAGTRAMLIVSFIGATFPNGAPKPTVHFTLPKR